MYLVWGYEKLCNILRHLHIIVFLLHSNIFSIIIYKNNLYLIKFDLSKWKLDLMNQVLLKIITVSTIVLFLIIFYSFFRNTDFAISNSFSKIFGERQPDSSIIIIHITDSDIQQIGPWPIKRSYYALLLQYLNQLETKKVGFEIFLSDRRVSAEAV